ncbi:unnamed protein product, partial [Pylaiella littoralis]
MLGGEMSMVWKGRLRLSVGLLYLLCWWRYTSATVAGGVVAAPGHQHLGRSRSSAAAAAASAAAFAVNTGATAAVKLRLGGTCSSSSSCSSGIIGRIPYFGASLLQQQHRRQQQRRNQGVLGRGCEGGSRGRGQCLMGVAGLTGYVNNNLKGAVAMEDLRKGDTLAIDGAGWMFRLLLGQRVDHGGDYDLFHKTIVREVTRIREAGLNLLVFMDGPNRKMKAATKERRRDEEGEKFANLYGYTLDGGGAFVGVGMPPDRSVGAFPLPMLAQRQFYASLRTAGVKIVECPGEADQELAKASAEDETGRTFAVGSDSDFFVFERCRYIHFDDLKLPDNNVDGTVDAKERVAQARVWTRERLAELCGISEQQVVEWAILMGNDYTRELSLPAIGFGNHKHRRPGKTLEYVRMIGPNVKIEQSETVFVRRRHSSSNRGHDNEEEEEYDEEEEEEYDEEEENDESSEDGDDDADKEEEEGGEEKEDGSSHISSTVASSSVFDEMEREEEEEEEEEREGEEDRTEAARGSVANSPPPAANTPTSGKSGKTKRSRRISEKSARAMEFSRALYALEPLDRFPDDVAVKEDDDEVLVAQEEEEEEEAKSPSALLLTVPVATATS